MKFYHIVKNYEPISIISSIAGLMLDSRNMEVFLTLQQSVHTAIRSLKDNLKDSKMLAVMNINQLVKNINESDEAKSISYLQDPAEELFTDNILFHGGNYVVFPGITSSGVYTLDLLLKTAFLNNSLIKHDSSSLFDLVHALLKISDEIASKSEIKAWQKFPESQTQSRTVSRPFNFTKLQKSLVFSKDELMRFLSEKEIQEIKKIACSIDDYPSIDFDPQACPLSLTPIIAIQDMFIVADPTGIISCIRNQIIITLINSEDKRQELLSNIKSVELSNIKMNLRLLHYEVMDSSLLETERPDFFDELLFSIDSKRIGYVQILFDDMTNYNHNIAFDHKDSKKEFLYVEKRHKEVYEKFLTPFFKEHSFFHILIQVPLGRTTVGGLTYLPPKTISIALGSGDLDTIAGLKNNDPYFLYNFAQAIHDLRNGGTYTQSFSYLDMLQFYLSRNKSFYVNDDFKPTMITFQTDFGRKLREEKALKEQKQNAYHYTKTLHPVVKKHIDGNIPIFVNLNFSKHGYEELVKNGTYVWCKVEDAKNLIPVSQFTEALSYWIWQISESYQFKLPSSLIKLSFSNDFLDKYEQHDIPEPPHNFEEIVPRIHLHKYVKTDANKPIISLELQGEALGLMFQNKNEFDRCLVKAVLSIYDLIINSVPSDEKILDDLVNIIAPYGNKKILTLQSSLSNPYLLENPNLDRVKISEYFSGKYLDELGEYIKFHLFNGNPSYDTLNKSQRYELYKITKDFYLNKLNFVLERFDKHKLLRAFLELNESLIHYEKINNVHFHTSIACYYSIHEKIEKEKKSNGTRQTTTLCTRFLIEYIYCSNFKGNEELERLEIQEILSIASQYISWGLASDEVRCNVFDHQYRFLKSNRIGIPESTKSGMIGFANKKLEEEIYSRYLKEEDNVSTPNHYFEKFKEAFYDEYGIDYNTYVNIISYLTEKSSLLKTNFISESALIDSKGEFQISDIKKTLELLTLEHRTTWETIPMGYYQHEIFPWRFKRRLSCLLKPILKISAPEKENHYYIYKNTILRSTEYMFQNFMSSGFANELFNSKKMRAFCGFVAENIGRNFELEVKEWFENFKKEKIKIFSGVEIGPNHRLKNSDNIGDIDLLLVNELRKEIIILELKAISGAKTPVEISSEIRNHFDNPDGKKTSIQKHLIRYNWIKENLQYVVQELKIPNLKYKVYQTFITDASIPSSFLKTLPKNIASFESLRWHQYNNFRKNYK